MAPAVCSTPRAAAVAELGAKKWREGKAIMLFGCVFREAG